MAWDQKSRKFGRRLSMQVNTMSNGKQQKRQRLNWEVKLEDKLKKLVENYWQR